MYSNTNKEVHEHQGKDIHVQKNYLEKKYTYKKLETWKDFLVHEKNFSPEKLEKDNHTIISCTKYKGYMNINYRKIKR
jgi:hypothetical protein